VPNLEKKTFDSPDRHLQPSRTTGALIDFDGVTLGRYTYAPGWRWIDDIAGGDDQAYCQVEHFGYALGGGLRVRHSDGTETQVGPGDVYHIAPSHRGEVVGDEPFETIEFLPATDGGARSAVG
jgi:hypothetical protein